MSKKDAIEQLFLTLIFHANEQINEADSYEFYRLDRSFIIIISIILGLNNLFARTELTEKRTYHSKTYANDDGTFTTEISLDFMHFMVDSQFYDINRNFQTIDTLGYNYAVNQGLYDVYLKQDLSANNPVVFETKDKFRLKTKTIQAGYFDRATKAYQSLQNVHETSGQVHGNSLYFENAFSHVDIKYTYLSTRLKEEIFITQAARDQLPNPAQYGFDLGDTYLVFVTRLDFDNSQLAMYAQNSDTIEATYEGEDRVNFKDLKKEIKYFFPVDIAYHLSEKDSLVRITEIKVRKRIYTQDGNRYLLIGVTLQWLQNLPAGTVVIDPTVVLQTDETCQDARVYTWAGDASTASTNYGSTTALLADAWTASGLPRKYRSFFKFDLSVIPSGSLISDADLVLTNDGTAHANGNYSRYSISQTYLRRVLEPWNEDSITWNNQPQDTSVHQVSVPAPSSPYDSMCVDVTELLQDILASDEGNHGFSLKLQNESPYRQVRYASKEHPDSSQAKLKVTFTEMQTVYYLKDHLGNIRVTINEDGDVITADDYYPFGKRLEGRSINLALTGNMYKFSSKELDEESGLDWYYFGARYYDPEIARWLSVDPLHNSYSDITPYNYVRNNPLRFIDLWGADSAKYTNSLYYSLFYDVHKHADNYYVYNNGSSGGSSSPSNTNQNGNDSENLTKRTGVSQVLGSGITLAGVYTQFSEWNYVFEGKYYNEYFAKWYTSAFRGNNFYSALSRYESLTSASAWRFASRGVFFVEIAVSAVGFINAYKNGDDWRISGALTILDIGASAVMTYGGAPGVFLGGTYFISAKVIGPWFYTLPPWQQ